MSAEKRKKSKLLCHHAFNVINSQMQHRCIPSIALAWVVFGDLRPVTFPMPLPEQFNEEPVAHINQTLQGGLGILRWVSSSPRPVCPSTLKRRLRGLNNTSKTRTCGK